VFRAIYPQLGRYQFLVMLSQSPFEIFQSLRALYYRFLLTARSEAGNFAM
jgi:hypothetical protein